MAKDDLIEVPARPTDKDVQIVERSESAAGRYPWEVSFPDGSFRRFEEQEPAQLAATSWAKARGGRVWVKRQGLAWQHGPIG